MGHTAQKLDWKRVLNMALVNVGPSEIALL